MIKHSLYIMLLMLLMLLNAGSMMGENCVRMTSCQGTREFASIVDAIEAANNTNDALLTLTDDCGIEDNETLTVKSSMTLELNGHEVYGFYKRLVTVSGAAAHLTVKNSTGDGQLTLESDSTAYCVYLEGGAKLTLESGRIQCIKEQSKEKHNPHYGVYLKDGSSFVMNGGTVKVIEDQNIYGVYVTGSKSSATINGGKITAQADIRMAYGINVASGTLTVNGGEVRSKYVYGGSSVQIGTNANVTVNGGKFYTASDNGTLTEFCGGTVGKVKIYDGIFSKETNMEKFLVGKYFRPLDKSSADFKAGYRVYLADNRVTDIAWNTVKGKAYETLEAALNEAVAGDTISLMNDYTLKNSVTVKRGVTLIVPYDLNSTWSGEVTRSAFYTANNELKTYTYRTLTLSDGVTVTVQGTMNVSAVQLSSNGGSVAGCGMPCGPHALVTMQGSSKIDVSGKMYCWGYVSGSGTVTIRSGATLYESYIIADHRGGTRSEDLEGKGMYPFNQYYVQNIEVPVTFLYGAKEMVSTHMIFELENWDITNITFLSSESKGLLQMKSGSSITRTYDSKTDRMTYDLFGNVNLGSIAMGYDSKNYSFPINSYMTLRVNGTLLMQYDYTLMPGARLEVAEGATATIPDGKKLTLYDRQDWGNFGIKGYVLPLAYTACNGYDNRTIRWGNNTDGFTAEAMNRFTSSAIDVKGTLNVKGNIMTSQHGADVTTTGNGTLYIYKGGIAAPQETWFEEKIAIEYHPVMVYALSNSRQVNLQLMGDMNGDRRISIADINHLMNSLRSGSAPSSGDYNADGITDVNDLQEMLQQYLEK